MRTERFRGALLSALVIASLMVPAISLLFVGPSIASPATMTIYPNDDVFVSQHFSDNNYGSSIHLEANGYPSEYIYSFLKFDLSSLEASAITSATLRLYCYFVNEEQYGGPRRLGCYEVENDDWDESTVTWNDKPLMGNLLDSVYPGAEPHWENFDVTSWVENRKGQLASFGLKTTADTLGDHWEAYSKEYDNYDPYLEVNYYMPPVAVDISPTQQGGLTGATLTYTVTVTNIGNVEDNYDLTVSDNENWGPTLSENLLDNVGPGENRVITLSATIPENATLFAEDSITVTATSVENALVSDNASCVARVQAPPGVVSYWKFDEGSGNIAYDNSGHGNYGTIYGATWTTGKIGGALGFGGDDYVLVPNSPSLAITDELTLEAWIKVQYSKNSTILAKRYRFTEVGYGLHFWDPERMVTFNVGATGYGGLRTREISLGLDKWYHIAGTYIENTGEWKIYVNGVLENSLTRPGELASNNAPLYIGSHHDSSFFRGVIDEIRIYNRALSPDEILLHYYLSIMEAHGPIYIDGNDNFTSANGVTSSSGTENDPYIIENWVISAENAHGIWVRNTNVHFIIKNCYIYDGYWGFNKGISFENVRNGKIVNVVSKNNWHGIYLTDSDNNRLKNNTCENNSNYGIALAFSDNNHIHHNNLINNQAYDDGTNTWDNGYPSGGNYWSDYAGVDENQGENQDIPGSDGIGDTPYNIPGGANQDRYPLVWTGTVDISLLNLYTVSVKKILDLGQGSKLVAKFYTYGDVFENESVIETFSLPWHVEENESARHPEGIGVKKARLDLTTDNTEDVISTVASFTVRRVTLELRYSNIPLEWALASPSEKVELEVEFSEVPLYWALAPD